MSSEVLEEIGIDFFQRHRLVIVEESEEALVVGLEEGTSDQIVANLRLVLDRSVKVVELTSTALDEALQKMMVSYTGESIVEEDENILHLDAVHQQDLLKDAGDAPVVRFINGVFLKAMETRSSDIHIEPYEEETVVRMRIDGVLHQTHTLPRSRHQQVSARLKVMSKLDLAESRRPQDGRLQVFSGDREVDVRLSLAPTLHGERIVMRLLEKNIEVLGLEQVGMLPGTIQLLKRILDRPYGLFLVTGPTGSGKSTTLYSILELLRSPECNVITIEDPVEYQVDGVGQIQVNDKIGLTFASGLRSVLRQDPDVLMVGEIRDPETAEIAVHAALTGHMVLSTLHTNDAPSAANRLIDLGVPPYLLSSCLVGVLAQRLVRRLCPSCRSKRSPSLQELEELGLVASDVNKVSHPVGCTECLDTGYLGRSGVFELMPVEEEASRVIAQSMESQKLRRASKKYGMTSLLEDAAQKVALGLTSVEEALRVARSF